MQRLYCVCDVRYVRYTVPWPAWSMESGEHVPDKAKFVGELVRVTAPGGRVIIATWCHRELKPTEKRLGLLENNLLGKISDAYYLPEWCAVSKYVALAKECGLEDVRSADWSPYIAPFWPAVVKSALVPRNLLRLLGSGLITMRAAFASLFMWLGYSAGLVEFVLVTGRKPK